MEKTIKLKLKEILTISAALQQLYNKQFSEFAQGYWFSRWFSVPLKKMKEESQNIQHGLWALIRKYGDKKKGDEKGYEINEESKNYGKYKAEVEKYLEEIIEIKLDVDLASINKLKEMNFNFTPVEFEAIIPFVSDDINKKD